MSEQAVDNGQSADKNSIMSLIHELNSTLPFDEFMELALYHPNYGYYTSDRKRVGTEGDFITSVSVGQCFGMVLAHHFAPLIESLASSSDEVVIVELGAEEGDLAKDMMDALSNLVSDSVFERLRYVAVEPFPPKRAVLRSNFIRDGLDEFEIISGFNELSVKNCILIANEVLDAIPVKRIRWNGREWDEVCVMVIDENGEKRLVESEERIQSSALVDTVKDFPTDLIKGFTVEVNLRYNKLFEDMFSASEILYGCLIDYGLRDGEIFDLGRKNGTLRAYSKHGIINDPLSSPGRIDLTAHVNFDHASSVARDCGFEVGSITDQYHFLVKAAEPWLLEIEKIGEPDAETVKLLRQFKMLFHPSVMGKDFKVMEIKKGI